MNMKVMPVSEGSGSTAFVNFVAWQDTENLQPEGEMHRTGGREK